MRLDDNLKDPISLQIWESFWKSFLSKIHAHIHARWTDYIHDVVLHKALSFHILSIPMWYLQNLGTSDSTSAASPMIVRASRRIALASTGVVGEVPIYCLCHKYFQVVSQSTPVHKDHRYICGQVLYEFYEVVRDLWNIPRYCSCVEIVRKGTLKLCWNLATGRKLLRFEVIAWCLLQPI